jgi:U3 small nucleolar RNA-associated protein 13
MSSTLKQSSDGLSKSWKAVKIHEPFFRGEKCELSSNNKYLVSIENENISFVDWNSGEILGRLYNDEDKEFNDVITCFCLHPNSNELVISTKNGLFKHFDINLFLEDKNSKSIKTCRSFKGHQMPVLTMAYDPSGTLVASGSADRTVRVWDVSGGYCTHW